MPIDTKENLQSALQSSKALCYLLIIGYSISLIFVTIFNADLYSPGVQFQDGTEKFFYIILYAAPICLSYYLIQRIKSGKYNSIPFLSIWLLLEMLAKISNYGLRAGFFVSLLIIVFSISCLRAWYKYKFN